MVCDWKAGAIAGVSLLAAAVLAAWSNPTPAAARPASCTPATAVHTTIAAIANDPSAWTGRCVTVSGVVAGSEIYADVDGFYVDYEYGDNPSTTGRILGFVDPRDKLGRLRGATLTGILQQCETAHAAARRRSKEADTWVMVTGFCHYYSSGPYLRVTHARTGPLPDGFERQQPARARQGFGDLVEMPVGWKVRAEVEEVAAEFLRLLRSGDRAAMLRYRMPDPVLAKEERWSARALDRLLFQRRDSPFATLRRSTGPVQTAFFIQRDAEDDGRRSATICFCNTTDCSRSWPISSGDADNLPGRPYACIETGRWLSHGRLWPYVGLPRAEEGLPEPSGSR